MQFKTLACVYFLLGGLFLRPESCKTEHSPWHTLATQGVPPLTALPFKAPSPSPEAAQLSQYYTADSEPCGLWWSLKWLLASTRTVYNWIQNLEPNLEIMWIVCIHAADCWVVGRWWKLDFWTRWHRGATPDFVQIFIMLLWRWSLGDVGLFSRGSADSGWMSPASHLSIGVQAEPRFGVIPLTHLSVALLESWEDVRVVFVYLIVDVIFLTCTAQQERYK